MKERGTSPVGPAAVAESLAALRAGWLIVLAFTALGLIAGVVYAAKSESTSRQVMRVELNAVGEDRTFSDLGISAPVSISPGDFLRGAITYEVAKEAGVDYGQVEGRLHVLGVPLSQSLISLEVDDDGNPEQARELLDTWYRVIQQDRRRQIKGMIDAGQASLLTLDELRDRVPESKLKKYREDALLKLNMLEASVRSDVKLDQEPGQVVTAQKSRAKYGLAGGLVGFVLGCGLVLVLGIVRGVARTAGGMEARFGAPVVADLADDQAQAAVSSWLDAADEPAIVDATGGSAEANAFVKQHPETTFAGSLGKAAPTMPAGSRSCLVLTRLGSSGLSESDQLRLVLAQFPDVQRVGLVLV